MSCERQFRGEQELERLQAALQDAIDYLRLMPVVPATHHKIADLEKALRQPVPGEAWRETSPWALERITPRGERLELSVQNGAVHFRTEVDLPKDAKIEWDLTRETMDSLIEVLIAERQQLKGY